MESKDIPIGELIKGRMKELHLSPTGLAKRLGYSLPGTTNILNRKTMQIDVLQAVGKALDYDFFKHYTQDTNEVVKEEKENKIIEQELADCRKENADLKKEMEYLKKIVELYEKSAK